MGVRPRVHADIEPPTLGKGAPRDTSPYADDLMSALASMLDLGVNVWGCDGQDVVDAFVVSGLAREFERQNPTYVAGKSGMELVELLLPFIGVQDMPGLVSCDRFDRTPDYWLGWVLGYFQMQTAIPYRRVFRAVPYRELVAMYHPLHEAPESKFVEALCTRLFPQPKQMQAKAPSNDVPRDAQTTGQDPSPGQQRRPTALRCLREAAGPSQSQLASASGVGLRSIQMYEQRNRDIGRARAQDVMAIARALECQAEELLEQ